MSAETDYTELQKERALDSIRRGKVDDFHPHDPERMDSFADVEICANLDPEFAQALAKAKLVGSRALLGRIHEISQSPLRADDKRAQTAALMTIAKQWNPAEFGDKKAIDLQHNSIQSLVHRPYFELSEDQKAEVDKFFGVGEL